MERITRTGAFSLHSNKGVTVWYTFQRHRCHVWQQYHRFRSKLGPSRDFPQVVEIKSQPEDRAACGPHTGNCRSKVLFAGRISFANLTVNDMDLLRSNIWYQTGQREGNPGSSTAHGSSWERVFDEQFPGCVSTYSGSSHKVRNSESAR
jgi:hypothetical protein